MKGPNPLRLREKLGDESARGPRRRPEAQSVQIAGFTGSPLIRSHGPGESKAGRGRNRLVICFVKSIVHARLLLQKLPLRIGGSERKGRPPGVRTGATEGEFCPGPAPG